MTSVPGDHRAHLISKGKQLYTHKEKPHPNETCIKYCGWAVQDPSVPCRREGPARPTLLTLLCPPGSSQWPFLVSHFTARLASLASQCWNALGLAMGLFLPSLYVPALGNLSCLHDFKYYLYCQLPDFYLYPRLFFEQLGCTINYLLNRTTLMFYQYLEFNISKLKSWIPTLSSHTHILMDVLTSIKFYSSPSFPFK